MESQIEAVGVGVVVTTLEQADLEVRGLSLLVM
jgi:hypothetical protein